MLESLTTARNLTRLVKKFRKHYRVKSWNRLLFDDFKSSINSFFLLLMSQVKAIPKVCTQSVWYLVGQKKII